MPKLSDKAFNDKYLLALKPKADRYDVFDAALRGLGIRVAPTGTKAWFVMRRVNGRMRRLTFGRYPDLPLSKARLKAADIVGDMAEGMFKGHQSVSTFRNLLTEWLEKDQAGSKSRPQIRRILEKDALPALGDMEIDKIEPKDIRRILDAIVKRGAPVHANRVRAYLTRLFNWAVEREHLDQSPCSRIKPPTKEETRDRVLELEELKQVWQAAEDMGYPFGPAIQLLMLTGQRRGEVTGAMWDEFDLDRGIWTIPKARAKNGRSHMVHLSASTIRILGNLPRFNGCPYLFSTTDTTPVSGFSKAKRRIDKKCEISNWTLHDLRRSAATHMAEKLKVSPVVVDRILNHVSGSVRGVTAIYQRGEYLTEREDAMARWSGLLLGDEKNDNEP